MTIPSLKYRIEPSAIIKVDERSYFAKDVLAREHLKSVLQAVLGKQPDREQPEKPSSYFSRQSHADFERERMDIMRAQYWSEGHYAALQNLALALSDPNKAAAFVREIEAVAKMMADVTAFVDARK